MEPIRDRFGRKFDGQRRMIDNLVLFCKGGLGVRWVAG